MTKEIAARLSISIQTVNFHLKNLYRKLGVSNRREAAAKATGRWFLLIPKVLTRLDAAGASVC